MMRQINLFNPALLPKKNQFSSTTMAQALGLIVLGLAGLSVFAQMQLASLQTQGSASAKRLSSLQAQLEKITADMPPKEKSLRLEQDLARAEQQMQGLQEVQGWLQAGNTTGSSGNMPGAAAGYASYMAGLARQSVNGLWLTGFQFEGPGQNIVLAGRTTQAALIPVYVQRLSNEASFHGKSFATLDITPGELDEKARQEARKRDANGNALAAEKENGQAPYLEFSLKGDGPGAAGAAKPAAKPAASAAPAAPAAAPAAPAADKPAGADAAVNKPVASASSASSASAQLVPSSAPQLMPLPQAALARAETGNRGNTP